MAAKLKEKRFYMGFGAGLITGIFLSHTSDSTPKQLAWKPQPGTVHSRGYLGPGTDFPVQVLISGSVQINGCGDSKALVKWISFSNSPEQFASTEWNWMTIKKINDTLHFIEEQKRTDGVGQLDGKKSGAGAALLNDSAPNDTNNGASGTRTQPGDGRGSTSIVSRLLVASAIVALAVVLAGTL